jgi:hypothetical protein
MSYPKIRHFPVYEAVDGVAVMVRRCQHTLVYEKFPLVCDKKFNHPGAHENNLGFRWFVIAGDWHVFYPSDSWAVQVEEE